MKNRKQVQGKGGCVQPSDWPSFLLEESGRVENTHSEARHASCIRLLTYQCGGGHEGPRCDLRRTPYGNFGRGLMLKYVLTHQDMVYRCCMVNTLNETSTIVVTSEDSHIECAL